MIKMKNTKLSDLGFIEIIISGGIIDVVNVNYYGTDKSVYNWLTLHYVCGKKSVGSSTCFGRDYEFNEDMAMLTQEAFSVFGLENAYIDFLKDLGFEESGIMTIFKPSQFLGQMRQNKRNNDIYTIVAWEDGKFLVEYEDEDNSQYRYSKGVVFGDKVVEKI